MAGKMKGRTSRSGGKKVRIDFDVYPEEKRALMKLAKEYRYTMTQYIRYLIRREADLPMLPMLGDQ